MLWVAKPVKIETNLPNTRFMSGSKTPDAIAIVNAMMFSIQLFRSAYVNTRFPLLAGRN